jgi:hypothetical protein
MNSLGHLISVLAATFFQSSIQSETVKKGSSRSGWLRNQ